MTTGNSGSTLITPEDVARKYAPPKYQSAQQANGSAGTDYSLHPKAQEAAAIFSDAMRELDNSRIREAAMQHKIDVQEAQIRDLQYQCDAERNQKERFQRYCVTMQTLVESIARASRQAADAAVAAAMQDEPPKQVAKPPVSPVEAEVEAAIKDMKTGQ